MLSVRVRLKIAGRNTLQWDTLQLGPQSASPEGDPDGICSRLNLLLAWFGATVAVFLGLALLLGAVELLLGAMELLLIALGLKFGEAVELGEGAGMALLAR